MKFAILVLVLAQDPVTDFRAAFDAARDEAGRVGAFEHLSRTLDPLIVNEASQYLTRGSEKVRTAAAGVLAGYAESETAARALLRAVEPQKSAAVKITLLRAVEMIDSEAAARWLAPHLWDADVGRVAVEVAGRIRSGEMVMPLIQRWAADDAFGDACREALRSITDQDLATPSAYAAWWKQNRATFRDPPDIMPE